MAMRVGKASWPDFSHRFSPKTYTGPQLFTCLALKAFFQTDFRGIVAILADSPDLLASLPEADRQALIADLTPAQRVALAKLLLK